MSSPLHTAGEASSEVLLNDDFKEGFDVTHTWALLSIGSFIANIANLVLAPASAPDESPLDERAPLFTDGDRKTGTNRQVEGGICHVGPMECCLDGHRRPRF